MPDVLDSMMAKVGGRAQRPPKVPVTPSLHPRTWEGQSPASGASDAVSAVDAVPTTSRAHDPLPPEADVPRSRRGHRDRGTVAQVPTKTAGAYAPRRGKVQLRADQESWLNGFVADAMREGVRVSEGDVLRLALDRLRAGGAGWPELREAVAGEIRARTRRR